MQPISPFPLKSFNTFGLDAQAKMGFVLSNEAELDTLHGSAWWSDSQPRLLIGEGSMRGRIEAQLAEDNGRRHIKLAGFRKDIPEILADIDLYVLAARSPEGVPQAVLQAHAARVPVVATDVGGVREVAIHGETALCAPRNDPETLAAHIGHLLDNPNAGQRLADNGYRLITERYSVEMMLNKMEYGGCPPYI